MHFFFYPHLPRHQLPLTNKKYSLLPNLCHFLPLTLSLCFLFGLTFCSDTLQISCLAVSLWSAWNLLFIHFYFFLFEFCFNQLSSYSAHLTSHRHRFVLWRYKLYFSKNTLNSHVIFYSVETLFYDCALKYVFKNSSQALAYVRMSVLSSMLICSPSSSFNH